MSLKLLTGLRIHGLIYQESSVGAETQGLFTSLLFLKTQDDKLIKLKRDNKKMAFLIIKILSNFIYKKE
jgi:hypothetical protein